MCTENIKMVMPMLNTIPIILIVPIVPEATP